MRMRLLLLALASLLGLGIIATVAAAQVGVPITLSGQGTATGFCASFVKCTVSATGPGTGSLLEVVDGKGTFTATIEVDWPLATPLGGGQFSAPATFTVQLTSATGNSILTGTGSAIGTGPAPPHTYKAMMEGSGTFLGAPVSGNGELSGTTDASGNLQTTYTGSVQFPVGGIAEVLVGGDSPFGQASRWSSPLAIALVAVVAALGLAAGGWYARRRWLL